MRLIVFLLLLPFFTLLLVKGHSQLNISPLLQDAVLKAISKSSAIKNNEILLHPEAGGMIPHVPLLLRE